MNRTLGRIAMAVALLGTVAEYGPAAEGTATTIADKTLVAWVQLADSGQQGGSALTLIDDLERFDAIVFGERSPGKWMAGSDFFRRTPADQQAYPLETAGPNDLVKIAIVYRGGNITLYRDRAVYAQYSVEQPQDFATDDTVLIGLRYTGNAGEIGFLRGIVEEARLYNRALDEATVAALEPNLPSDPQPLGWWTFEDGTARDATGTFPQGVLMGGARIVRGRLHLNGTDAYVLVERPIGQPQGFFYRPRSRATGRMWDTWLYLHEGTYYLYYLANAGPAWNNISLATSPDGAHWVEQGVILRKASDAVWMGTGSTWKSPHDEQTFFLNFSEWRGNQQTIFFAESNDLVHWRRLDEEFRPDPRWYNVDRGGESRWDCIYTISRTPGGLYGYWTATPKAETGGRFGFGESLDGHHWQALPPPAVHGVGGGEVGAIERIGDRYYLMFGTEGLMVTLLSEQPSGPFHAAQKNFRLLSGHTYFARFFPTPDGVLVNHHSIARDGNVFFAPLKGTRIDEQGTLRLSWWKGNEAFKHGPTEVTWAETSADASASVALLGTRFDVNRGVILEGVLRLPGSPNARPNGLYVEYASDRGTAVLVSSAGATELGTLRPDDGNFESEKRVDREWPFGETAQFRLLLKRSLLEFYLDDVLIECFSLPGPATGRIGFIRGSADEVATDLRAWNPG